jgi:hypothetical protein
VCRFPSHLMNFSVCVGLREPWVLMLVTGLVAKLRRGF